MVVCGGLVSFVDRFDVFDVGCGFALGLFSFGLVLILCNCGLTCRFTTIVVFCDLWVCFDVA